MYRPNPSLPPTSRRQADGTTADHSWIKLYPARLAELLTAENPSPAALRLLLHLTTRLDHDSATVSNWVTSAAAHQLHRDPDTISSATTELANADVLRKHRRHGTAHLHLDPTLVFRGRRAAHLDVLAAERRHPPREHWAKAFTPHLHQIADSTIRPSDLRVLLFLITQIADHNITRPLAAPRIESTHLHLSASAWSAALKSLDEAGHIARIGTRNSGPITINPRYAFIGDATRRTDALTGWTRRHTARPRLSCAHDHLDQAQP